MAFVAIAPIFPAPIANAIARLVVCVALVLMYHMSAGYMFAFTLMHSHVCVALGLLHHMPCVHRLAMEPHPTAVLAMSPEMTFKRVRHMR